jgi:1-acyl-sn-glycerol-3-phosphate acyltransferase
MLKRLGFIAVERGSANASEALDVAAAALAAGEAVGIFPEGRTTRDPEHWPERAKTGAVRLALRSGAPIVPVGMVGTHRVLTRGHMIRSLLVSVILRPRVQVEVGRPIDVRALAGGEEASPQQIRALADQVMGSVVALVEVLRNEIASEPTGVAPAPADAPATLAESSPETPNSGRHRGDLSHE